MKYYTVSFEYAEDVFCTNIAHAPSAEAAEAQYRAKYGGLVSVRDCPDWELDTARCKGMPFVEITPT